MRKNIVGLIRSAKQRSANATKRASTALERMISSDQQVNFQTVAAAAKVSTAWLYSQPELRLSIMRLRKTQPRTVLTDSDTQQREQASRQNIVMTLRLRIKALEEKNRELTELLERAYGELAQAREREISGRRLHANNVRSRSSTKKTLDGYR